MPSPGRDAAGIEIDVSVGYGDAASAMPEALRQAVRMLVAHWYENRGLIAFGQTIAVMPAATAALIAPLPGAVAMTEIGDLKHRLVLEAPVETDDAAGGVTRSYATAATRVGVDHAG